MNWINPLNALTW